VERRILVVDPDVAFATMLKEGLESSGDYDATAVNTGTDALQSIIEQKQPFSLVIIDMGVRDIRPGTLVRAIREAKPNMRILLIPLIGQELPPSAQALNVQGVLPKPFFMGELPNIIEAAFGLEAGQPAPLPQAPAPSAEPEPALDLGLDLGLGLEAEPSIAPEPALDLGLDLGLEAEPSIAPEPALDLGLDLGLEAEPPPIAELEPTPPEPAPLPVEQPAAAPALSTFSHTSALRRKMKDIERLLDDLNREVRAEAILVTSGGELVAFAGVLGRERTEELATLVAGGAQTSARVASFLGEPEGRFEQSLHQGNEYTLFSLSPAEGLVISLALSSTTPLGIIRYNTLRTGKALLKLAGV
jgi:CheY-like chemotaxis protein